MPDILIVDDDTALNSWLQTVLRNGGYSTRSVESSELMFAEIEREAPGLLLLDVLLPGVNGMEALKRLREDPRTREMPVILITVLDPGRYMRAGLDLGASDFLVKPLSGPEVLQAVQARLAPGTPV